MQQSSARLSSASPVLAGLARWVGLHVRRLGQFERDLIQERTRAGLGAAAARGRTGGRKPVMTDEKLKLKRARELMAKGLAVREAAARLRVGKTALYAALQVAQAEEEGALSTVANND